MSNQRLVEILNQGVSFWNTWRSDNYVENPDFSGEDFSGRDFTGADLNGAIFANCNLTDTNFTEAILHSASFVNADINGANFTKADLRHAVDYKTGCFNSSKADFTDAIF